MGTSLGSSNRNLLTKTSSMNSSNSSTHTPSRFLKTIWRDARPLTTSLKPSSSTLAKSVSQLLPSLPACTNASTAGFENYRLTDEDISATKAVFNTIKETLRVDHAKISAYCAKVKMTISGEHMAEIQQQFDDAAEHLTEEVARMVCIPTGLNSTPIPYLSMTFRTACTGADATGRTVHALLKGEWTLCSHLRLVTSNVSSFRIDLSPSSL